MQNLEEHRAYLYLNLPVVTFNRTVMQKSFQHKELERQKLYSMPSISVRNRQYAAGKYVYTTDLSSARTTNSIGTYP